MKITDVVRGVKLMYDPTKSYQPDYPDDYTRGEVSAHNRLASAEVVVDSHLLEVIRKHIDSDGKLVGGVPRLYNAIANSIEQGKIISVKENV